ncbi:MAG: beta-hydroxyacyl-ACP dehydratase [Crocinitomicaceae bacterium]|nr:beta-hydroxyacyl-ACP dehydratase [Crocinitomicaceae bacterium]
MRFLLIDRITEINPGETAEGIKCWSLDNPIFQDHFPGFPIVPGVMLTESMAQLSGRLLEESYYAKFPHATKVYPILSIIQKAKFKHFVQPGDQCILKSKVISLDNIRGNVTAETYVNDQLMCSATLSFLLGLKSDMEENPFIHKMDEFFHNIKPKG